MHTLAVEAYGNDAVVPLSRPLFLYMRCACILDRSLSCCWEDKLAPGLVNPTRRSLMTWEALSILPLPEADFK